MDFVDGRLTWGHVGRVDRATIVRLDGGLDGGHAGEENGRDADARPSAGAPWKHDGGW